MSVLAFDRGERRQTIEIQSRSRSLESYKLNIDSDLSLAVPFIAW